MAQHSHHFYGNCVLTRRSLAFSLHHLGRTDHLVPVAWRNDCYLRLIFVYYEHAKKSKRHDIAQKELEIAFHRCNAPLVFLTCHWFYKKRSEERRVGKE